MATQTKTGITVTDKPGTSWYRDFVQSPAAGVFAGLSRILLGFVFLWAFIDKNWGLQFATPHGQGWVFGTGVGSPTYGFLKFGANPDSPLSAVYVNFANAAEGNPNAWTNWVFMAGLLGIGLALIFGVFMRIGTISAVVLLLMMWLAMSPFPWTNIVDPATGQGAFNGPILDDHIIYGTVLITLMLMGAERHVGLGKWWQSLGFVKKMPWLA